MSRATLHRRLAGAAPTIGLVKLHGAGLRAPVGAWPDSRQRMGSSPSRIPAIVAPILATPGDPLPAAERGFMEERFGQDFSAVRVHGDAPAMRSARAVGARAYVVGQHLVLGDGPSSLHGGAGRRLLAHELTHTLQQRQLPPSASPAIGPPDSAEEREADQAAERILAGRAVAGASWTRPAVPTLHRMPRSNAVPMPRQTSPDASSTRPPVAPARFPVHGTNPADCMEPACVAAARMPPPRTPAAAVARVDAWERAALDCVRTASSNATHQPAIVANETGEIAAATGLLRAAAARVGTAGHSTRDFVEFMGETCTSRVREARIEFDYNVIFDNPPGATVRWGVGAGSWDRVEGALAALPASATWGNPQLITFSRSACDPDDLDATGVCRGRGNGLRRSFVGAQTSNGRITVYNHGLGAGPYPRSAQIGLSATDQTIRHEVGHVMDAQIPAAESERFFRDVVQWRRFSWDWINRPAPRTENQQEERDVLRGLLGFDEPTLTSWLASLRPGVPVRVRGWTCVHGPERWFLTVLNAAHLPQGVEFSYARAGQDEYIAELYALAVSRPQFLHDALPAAQVEWLKRVVFHTPATPREWATELAARDLSGEPRLLARLMRVFTWKQVGQILDSQPLPGGGHRV